MMHPIPDLPPICVTLRQKIVHATSSACPDPPDLPVNTVSHLMDCSVSDRIPGYRSCKQRRRTTTVLQEISQTHEGFFILEYPIPVPATGAITLQHAESVPWCHSQNTGNGLNIYDTDRTSGTKRTTKEIHPLFREPESNGLVNASNRPVNKGKPTRISKLPSDQQP